MNIAPQVSGKLKYYAGVAFLIGSVSLNLIVDKTQN
jgi:hypothetical protein